MLLCNMPHNSLKQVSSLFCSKGTQESWSVTREHNGHNVVHKDGRPHLRNDQGHKVGFQNIPSLLERTFSIYTALP